jgi:hypothetical protein
VPRVDQLAAVLRDLALLKRVANRPAAATHPGRGFVQLGRVARLLQPVGARQPGETGADDDDLRGGRPTSLRDPDAEEPCAEGGGAA